MKPCMITISMEEGQARVAKMLARNKNATCKFFNISAMHLNFFLHTKLSNIFAVAVKDDEIENWAAQKIQRSFKQYKHQKSNREKMLPPPDEVEPPPSSS